MLPIRRRIVKENRLGAFGRIVRKYSNDYIDSKVVFKNVLNCRIDRQEFIKNGEEIILLFGIQLDATTLYLGSADELSGVTGYELRASIGGIDLEIIDTEENG